MLSSLPKSDILVVGLGNPGKDYIHTRHNLGWMVVDELATEGSWSSWNWSGKGLVTAGMISGHTVMMLKPTTMMNLSGEAVVALMTVIDFKHIVVIHDELDIEFADVKAKFSGGAAGHRGVANIILSLGHKEFSRVRCGIGRPESGTTVINHVLGAFSATEAKSLPGMVNAAVLSVKEIITNLFVEEE